MPQKKNPYSLAYVRGVTADLIGQAASTAAFGQTPSAQPDNRIFIYGNLPRALDRATEAAGLMAEVVRGLAVNAALMARRAANGFSQATDLADVIMLEAGVDFRTAHEIIGRVVRQALESGIVAREITPAMLDRAAQEVGAGALRLPATVLSDALDPRSPGQRPHRTGWRRRGAGARDDRRMSPAHLRDRRMAAGD